MDRIELGSQRVLRSGRLLWIRALAWGVLLLAAVYFMSQFCAELPYHIEAILDPRDSGEIGDGPTELLAMLFMGLAGLATYAGLVTWGEGRLPAELSFRTAPRELLIGIALGGAMMLVIVAMLWIPNWVILAAVPMQDPWLPVAIALAAAAVEEILFRLIVFRLLWRVFGLPAALSLSAILFGALHLLNPQASLFAAVSIAAAGVMLAGFYMLTGRVWMATGIHAGWNFVQGWLFGAAVSGTNIFGGGPLDLRPAPDAPAILSGGGFGPEASVPGLLVGILVAAFSLHMGWRRGRFAPQPTPIDAEPEAIAAAKAQ